MTSKVKRRKGVTRLSRKNQVTLPVAALVDAHIRAGDQLRVEVEGAGRIRLIRELDAFEQLAGSIPGLSEATGLQALRDEWPQ